MFRKCPARLGDLVRRNDLRSLTLPGAVITPPAEAIRWTYQDLWGSSGRCDLPRDAALPSSALQPITSAEVRRRIKKLKPRGAPGEDGVRRENLVSLEGGPNLLAGLFNCLLWTGYYPTVWKRNVTSMIPKEGKDLNSPGGWRPITLSSVLAYPPLQWSDGFSSAVPHSAVSTAGGLRRRQRKLRQRARPPRSDKTGKEVRIGGPGSRCQQGL